MGEDANDVMAWPPAGAAAVDERSADGDEAPEHAVSRTAVTEYASARSWWVDTLAHPLVFGICLLTRPRASRCQWLTSTALASRTVIEPAGPVTLTAPGIGAQTPFPIRNSPV